MGEIPRESVIIVTSWTKNSKVNSSRSLKSMTSRPLWKSSIVWCSSLRMIRQRSKLACPRTRTKAWLVDSWARTNSILCIKIICRRAWARFIFQLFSRATLTISRSPRRKKSRWLTKTKWATRKSNNRKMSENQFLIPSYSTLKMQRRAESNIFPSRVKHIPSTTTNVRARNLTNKQIGRQTNRQTNRRRCRVLIIRFNATLWHQTRTFLLQPTLSLSHVPTIYSISLLKGIYSS